MCNSVKLRQAMLRALVRLGSLQFEYGSKRLTTSGRRSASNAICSAVVQVCEPECPRIIVRAHPTRVTHCLSPPSQDM